MPMHNSDAAVAYAADVEIYRSIKKPKTQRYPSLKGTDPKFRRNHRHALHGTAKALVRASRPTDCSPLDQTRRWLT